LSRPDNDGVPSGKCAKAFQNNSADQQSETMLTEKTAISRSRLSYQAKSGSPPEPWECLRFGREQINRFAL